MMSNRVSNQGWGVEKIFTQKLIGQKAHEKQQKVYVDLDKAYNRVSREAMWEVLRMYDVGGKILNGIKSQVCMLII